MLAKPCPSGYKEDSKVSSKTFQKGSAWISRRGCVPHNKCDKKKGGKDCNWHGEFKSCNPDPNNKGQRKDVYEAAIAFQDERVKRIDEILGYSRRRVVPVPKAIFSTHAHPFGAAGRMGMDQLLTTPTIQSSTPRGSVTLAVDAALRKAIAHMRKDMCAGDLSRPRSCSERDYNRLDGGETSAVFEKWKYHMKEDHGIDLRSTAYKKNGGPAPSSMKVDANARSAVVEYHVNIDGTLVTKCKVNGKIKMKIDLNCKCSPFMKVKVEADRIVQSGCD